MKTLMDKEIFSEMIPTDLQCGHVNYARYDCDGVALSIESLKQDFSGRIKTLTYTNKTITEGQDAAYGY